MTCSRSTFLESPVAGQSMPDILRGFIRAGRGPQDQYSVAREFLTSDADWMEPPGC